MGILKKILGEEKLFSEEKKPDKKNLSEEKKSETKLIKNKFPTKPCPKKHPGPTPPYGLHHWLDPFGTWHCTECEPPATRAMVRDEIIVGVEVDGAEVEPNDRGQTDPRKKIQEEFSIVAIESPDGHVAFSPDTTQAQRKMAAETFDWFRRSDSRRASKEVAKATSEVSECH
jgi:hypothetical protein